MIFKSIHRIVSYLFVVITVIFITDLLFAAGMVSYDPKERKLIVVDLNRGFINISNKDPMYSDLDLQQLSKLEAYQIFDELNKAVIRKIEIKKSL